MGDDWNGHVGGNTDLSGPRCSSKSKSTRDLPVAVGFGISTPEQAAKVAFRADAVVVGSAIVWRMDEHGKDPAFIRQVTGFVRALAEAIHGTRR